ncbi:cell division protein FtsQ [Mucilaginibacter yixingensis]|uniref:Cell division protein FtsQ n=1 Tax=Mucilaginibacter yixingensis TaxID=1295612 RepID=A0A2T5J798_9SPHI|nr:cell division protein FtsQ [Mucilaginibacter yixingensis]PTQ95027.1 cell division protein FtsQ [Mucilaginibacter yixingensis]
MFKDKRLWRTVLFSCIWVVFLAGMGLVMSFVSAKKAAIVCTKVQVIIPGNQYFIDKGGVSSIIGIESNSLVGRKLQNINIQALESKLRANPFVEAAKVYTDMDGVITVEISQRRPLMRIINNVNQDYYIDEHGLKVPLSDNFTAKVLVANGVIDEPFFGKVDTLKYQLTKDLFKTAQYISKDSLWSAQIGELYVNSQREIELVPRVGNQRILLGTADSLETKLANLRAFYKQAIPLVGWDAYRVINIKYPNQVIGIRNENAKKDTSAIKKDSTKTVATATVDTILKN